MKESGHAMEYFVVFPDDDGASAVAGSLPGLPEAVLRYPSGRPWLVASRRFTTITLVRAGARAIATIGPGPLSQAEAARAERDLAATTGVAGLTSTICALPGIHHIVAAVDGELRVQGTASGTRRVYHAKVRGLTVFSDRAELLAALTGAEIDEGALAARLLEPLPHPLGERPLWRGVHAVPPGHFVTGTARVTRWWTPPAPEGSAADGALAVQAALTASVRAFCRERGTVLSELSGGYDSTAVTALAHREHAGALLAVTVSSRDAFGSDQFWAEKAVAGLPGLTQRVLAPSDMPLTYANLLGSADHLDEPSVVVANRAALRTMIGIGRGVHAEVYLTGHGGDHLFCGHPALVRDLFRTRPVAALRRLAAYRAMLSWPLPEITRQLASRRGYRRWLADSLRGSTALDFSTPALTWGITSTLHPWLTAHGRALVHREVRMAAEHATPLAAGQGRHAELDAIAQGARFIRALTDISAGLGLPLAAPFFDDRVIEAALAVNLADRVDPWQYKPVLREAMRGIVPAAVLDRTSKDEGSLDTELGMRDGSTDVRALWTDSRLAARGLVDAVRLRELCAHPDAPELADGALDTTIACEVWLRAQENMTTEKEQSHGVATA
ncbi:asparagine synthase-related protein [Amycolatopsis sp. NPDC059657]|uniref:asparagine synthase-related protein n=1 Tax=Amycolatopsis sp. NPDC059657 TaxID=3346899 RepID=UPI00366C4E33